ncbi:MAG: protein N-lysine methyltransferase family protein [bacterium]|nr:protein N-lysine methyltransferase family protein [bacterium]
MRSGGRGAWVGPEHESPDWEPPYWVEVWPSARAAVWALARWSGVGSKEAKVGEAGAGVGDPSRSPLRGLRVLDLGCGLGVPGIGAARCGASVLFQDRSADALAFALWNARRVGADVSVLGAVEGAWGDTATVDQTLDWLGRVDASASGRSIGFDVIVMADVSYHVPAHDELLRLVESVAASDTVVLHADPERADSTRFLERLPGSWGQFGVVRTVRHEDKATRVRLVVAGQRSARRDVLVAAVGAEARAVADVCGRASRRPE